MKKLGKFKGLEIVEKHGKKILVQIKHNGKFAAIQLYGAGMLDHSGKVVTADQLNGFTKRTAKNHLAKI